MLRVTGKVEFHTLHEPPRRPSIRWTLSRCILALGTLGFWVQAQDLGDGDQYLVVLRSGMVPPVVAAGETVEYRVVYELRTNTVRHVEVARGTDWSPLTVHSYRYWTNELGQPCFSVVLRVPESLVDTNSTRGDRWFFFSPSLRVEDVQGVGHVLEAPPGFVQVLVQHALTVAGTSGSVAMRQPPGSWWLLSDVETGYGTSEPPVRDGTTVLIPPGGEILLGGLDGRVVGWMLRDFTLNWPQLGEFLVDTEGPFELFSWEDPGTSWTERRTRVVPGVRGVLDERLAASWGVGVRPRPGVRPGDTGKLQVRFELGDGREWGRWELPLVVVPEPLQRVGGFTAREETTDPGNGLSTTVQKRVSLGGWQVAPGGGYRVDVDLFLASDSYGRTNGLREYPIYRLTSQDPASYTDCFGRGISCRETERHYLLGGSLTCETVYSADPVPVVCEVFTYSPGSLLAGWTPSGAWEPLGTMQVPWFHERGIRDRASGLGVARVRARVVPPSRIRYVWEGLPAIRLGTDMWEARLEGLPKNDVVSTWSYRFIEEERPLATLGADLTDGHIQGAWYLGGRFGWLNVDATAGGTALEEGDEVSVELLAQPSALRLETLPMTNRPWVELLVQAREGDGPWAGQPVVVEGPPVGELALEEPRRTDSYGHYAFYWQPPGPDWFTGRPLPQRFWFTVRLLGGRSAHAVVEVGQRLVRGQVLRRHAGADPVDPEGDGLSPVAGAEVSWSPDFAAETTGQTDAQGRFALALPESGTYTVYVRKPGGPPPWTVTRSGPVPVAGADQEVALSDPLYLASLSVLEKLRSYYLPPVTNFLAPTVIETWLQMAPPTHVGSAIESFLTRLQTQEETAAHDEEALRRLNLAVWMAFEGTRAADEVARFAADQVWEGSLGALTRLLRKTIEQIKVVEILKGRLQRDIAELTASGGDPVRLKQLRDQLALLEAAQERFLEIQRRINRAAHTFYSQLAVRLAKSAPDARQTKVLFLKLALYWNQQIQSLVGDQVEQWVAESRLGRRTAEEVARLLEPVEDALAQLDQNLREALGRYLALGFRHQVAAALLEASEAAATGRFPQRPYSYAAADRAVGLALERLQDEVGRFRTLTAGEHGYGFWLDFVNGVIADWDSWAGAALTALTAGTAAAAVQAADKVLHALEALLPVAQLISGLTAAQAIDEDGGITAATVHGIRLALSQAGRFRVRVHSPVHLLAVDAWGRRTGMDAGGNLYAEIPGAWHVAAGVQQPEELWLPASETPYRLLISGTAPGDYRVESGMEMPDGTFRVDSAWGGVAAPGRVRTVSLIVGETEVRAPGAEEPVPPANLLELRDEAGRAVTNLLLGSGGSTRMRPVLLGTDGLPLPEPPQRWEVQISDTNLAVVRQEGTWWELKALRAGTGTLQVSLSNLLATVPLAITSSWPSELSLTATPSTVDPGATVQLTARVSDGFQGLGGWPVRLRTPLWQTNPIDTAITDAQGVAAFLWTVPSGWSGPILWVADVQRPDGVPVTAALRLGSRFPSAQAPGVPVDGAALMDLQDTEAGIRVQINVPPAAFPGAGQPVGFLDIVSRELPALGGDWQYVAPPVDLTFYDAAAGRLLQPDRPLTLVFGWTNEPPAGSRGWLLVETNGRSMWQEIRGATAVSNGVALTVERAGVVAWVQDLRPPELVGTEPTNGAVDVPRTMPLRLRFHEPVRLGDAAPRVQLVGGDRVVPVRFRVETDEVIIEPAPAWAPLALHRVMLPADALRDEAGNPNAPLTFEFTARAAGRPRLWIREVRAIAGGGVEVRLTFETEPGLTYVLDSCDDLGRGNWQVVATVAATASGALQDLTEQVPPTVGQRYYRVRVLW